MAEATSSNGSTLSYYDKISFPGHEITWAGECPWNNGLCYGTEAGKLLIPSEISSVFSYDLVDSDAVINGVAFADGNLVAVSTPAEVLFFHRNENDGQLLPLGTRFDGGAHDIISTGTGGFVAPLGINGLLLFELPSQGRWKKRIARMNGNDFYFYRIVRLGQSGGHEAYACALRDHGLFGTTLPSQSGSGAGLTHSFEGLDVISVCSLGHPEWPFAVASLGRDGTLLLCRNVLDAEPPLTLNFDLITGTGYTVLSVRGHIVILTSRSVFVFPELASRFLSNEPLDVPLTVARCPFDGVEIYLAYDRWLLVEVPDGVLRLEIDRLVGFASGPSADQSRPVVGEARWESRNVLDLTAAALV